MAHLNTSKSLVRRSTDDVALMPPPPVKRIKRPPKVLDEDDYTSALSDIIARDYFPGLRETQAQQDYLTALDSRDGGWIAEAGQKLREAMTPQRERRSTRNEDFWIEEANKTVLYRARLIPLEAMMEARLPPRTPERKRRPRKMNLSRH